MFSNWNFLQLVHAKQWFLVCPHIEQADEDFLSKANGKTVFTAKLAQEFGFKEDYDTDGSVNRARLEAAKPFLEMMAKPVPQYDIKAELPDYTDFNNEGLAEIFAGAKPKK